MKFLLHIALALGLAVTTGCLAFGGRMQSYTAETFPVSAGQAMVNDVAERLYSAYPPGMTSLFLAGADDFGQALDESLRGRG